MTVVAGCVFQDNNRILMVQEGQGVEKELWNFPSGRISDNKLREHTLIRRIISDLKSKPILPLDIINDMI